MPEVVWTKKVSDKKVREMLERVAAALGRDVHVTSGDRTGVPKGGSKTSHHLAKRAVDFWCPGEDLGKTFERLRKNADEIFGDGSAWQVIHHGAHTATGGPHLHVGRYADGDRRVGASFVVEGLKKAKANVYDEVGTYEFDPASPTRFLRVPSWAGTIRVEGRFALPALGRHRSSVTITFDRLARAPLERGEDPKKIARWTGPSKWDVEASGALPEWDTSYHQLAKGVAGQVHVYVDAANEKFAIGLHSDAQIGGQVRTGPDHPLDDLAAALAKLAGEKKPGRNRRDRTPIGQIIPFGSLLYELPITQYPLPERLVLARKLSDLPYKHYGGQGLTTKLSFSFKPGKK